MKKLKIDQEMAKNIKEKKSSVSLDYRKSVELLNTEMEVEDDKNEVLLPDGAKLDYKKDALKMTESLFTPKVIGDYRMGLQDLLFESLMKVDYDYRKELLSNLIIAGGNTNFGNFNERLQLELSAKFPNFHKFKCYNLSDKSHSTWFGGAILSTLGTFQPMWITRKEYNECGPAIINRKAL